MKSMNTSLEELSRRRRARNAHHRSVTAVRADERNDGLGDCQRQRQYQ